MQIKNSIARRTQSKIFSSFYKTNIGQVLKEFAVQAMVMNAHIWYNQCDLEAFVNFV